MHGAIPTANIYSTWSEDVELWSVDDDTLMDLSAVSEITLRLKDPFTGFYEMSLSMSNGDITIPSQGIIEWIAKADAMGTVRPKLYEMILLVHTQDRIETIFLGPVSIIE
jgi:hypothetical protein